MKNSDHVRGSQKLQLAALMLLCLIGGLACGKSGSSSIPIINLSTQSQELVSGGSATENQDVAPVQDVAPLVVVAVQQKSVGPRNGVCWNSRSQLREVTRKRLINQPNRSCGAVDYQRKVNLLLAAN